ncbi:hypothetical protein ACTSKR_16175 [Chitinibacteraceae bacterium HSL-7]
MKRNWMGLATMLLAASAWADFQSGAPAARCADGIVNVEALTGCGPHMAYIESLPATAAGPSEPAQMSDHQPIDSGNYQNVQKQWLPQPF